jgi:hypothetical protein
MQLRFRFNTDFHLFLIVKRSVEAAIVKVYSHARVPRSPAVRLKLINLHSDIEVIHKTLQAFVVSYVHVIPKTQAGQRLFSKTSRLLRGKAAGKTKAVSLIFQSLRRPLRA